MYLQATHVCIDHNFIGSGDSIQLPNRKTQNFNCLQSADVKCKFPITNVLQPPMNDEKKQATKRRQVLMQRCLTF